MDWNEAQNRIRARVKVGTDVNTPTAHYRIIESVDATVNSQRYGYRNERGFVIPIGQASKIKIPWSVLKECFLQLKAPQGYNGAFFREHFRRQAADHPCHVHVIGQILVAARIAQTDGQRYWISTGQK